MQKFYVSGEHRQALVAARGNSGEMDRVLSEVFTLARGREVVAPDTPALPTGTLKERGVTLLDPDTFFAEVKASLEKRHSLQQPVCHPAVRSVDSGTKKDRAAAEARRAANRAARLAAQPAKGPSGQHGGNAHGGKK